MTRTIIGASAHSAGDGRSATGARQNHAPRGAGRPVARFASSPLRTRQAARADFRLSVDYIGCKLIGGQANEESRVIIAIGIVVMSLGKWKRRSLVALSYLLSRENAKHLYHWIEGYRANRRLRKADVVFVSLPKSGRTWLRVMLWRFYQQRFVLAERSQEDLEHYHRGNAAVPYLYFTHDNHLRHYLKLKNPADRYAGKKIVLLVRDPRDGAVSMYFQWTHRMDPSKRFFSKFGDRDYTLEEFVLGSRDTKGVIYRRVNVLNRWAKAKATLTDFLMVRYEDLQANPEAVLGIILEFVETPATFEELREAVAFASFEKMRVREAQTTKASPRRLRPGEKQIHESFKTRRATVGGYQEYFSNDQIEELDSIISSQLDPIFGY